MDRRELLIGVGSAAAAAVLPDLTTADEQRIVIRSVWSVWSESDVWVQDPSLRWCRVIGKAEADLREWYRRFDESTGDFHDTSGPLRTMAVPDGINFIEDEPT